jgi:glucose-6-phosphate isomerase
MCRMAFKPQIDLHFADINASEMKSLLSDASIITAHEKLQKLTETAEIGFGTIPFDEISPTLAKNIAEKVKNGGFESIILCGIGGSALGTASLHEALPSESHLTLYVIDHIDPDAIHDIVKQTDLEKTHFIFISKSGNTSETLAQWRYFENITTLNSQNTTIITDPENGFLREVLAGDFPNLCIPGNVGGRFSAFTSAGLFPLELMNHNTTELLSGARDAQKDCEKTLDETNPALLLTALWKHHFKSQKRSELVFMPYSFPMRFVADWFSQLFAESIGKENSGFTPIKSLGVTDQHSQLQLYLEGPDNKLITTLSVEKSFQKGELSSRESGDKRFDFLAGKLLTELNEAERQATVFALAKQNRPVCEIILPERSAYQLGYLYQTLMNTVALFGLSLGINPFDQPAVEQIKKNTFALMGHEDFQDLAEELKK